MSLKALVGQRIINDVIKSVKVSGEWKALVVDHLAMRVISSCCRMHDIMMEGITIVEDLNKGRESLPLEAIYFITPTEKSIDKVLDDFKDAADLRYTGAHIFFTETCPPELFEKLGSPKGFLSRKIRTLKEVNISFMPIEAQVFSLDAPNAFHELFSASVPEGNRSKMAEVVAEQLATVCATLGENPSIRYHQSSSSAAYVAHALLNRLTAFTADDPSFGEGVNKQHSQLIILDRGFDCISPLLHELTYQAMAYDLLDIQKDVYRYEEKTGGEYQQKEVILDENDEIWKRLRHKHIALVSKEITKLFKDFQDKKKVAIPGKEKDQVSIKDLHLIMKKLPQYQKELNKYRLHLYLADDCMSHYNKAQIEKLCFVEQDFATGFDKDGEKVRDLMRAIVPVLLDKDTSEYNKIRVIILLAIVMQGLSEENMTKLMEHARISDPEKVTLRNMEHLGVSIIQEHTKKKPLPSRKVRQETHFTTSRYVPYIKDIMEDAADNKLDVKQFPYLSARDTGSIGVSGVTSARRGNFGNWHKDKNQTETISGPRLIIFILGGMCYSETRSAYEVTEAYKDTTKNWECIIGSTELITPDNLLGNLVWSCTVCKSLLDFEEEEV
eukprot:gene7018-7803_t